MSFESEFWKKMLKKDISYIKNSIKKLENIDGEEINDNDNEYEKIFSNIEIKIFIMAYSMRKLSEYGKVTDKVTNFNINVCKYPKNSKKFGLLGDSNFEKYYFLDKENKDKINMKKINNWIIHSSIFEIQIFPKYFFKDLIDIGDASIFFTSDYNKNKFLYKLMVLDFLNIVKEYSESYPWSTQTKIVDGKIIRKLK